MNIEEIREYALTFEGVEESFPFGDDTLVFKVNRKIFLFLSLNSEELRFNVKCNPETAVELREQYNNIIPGWHMNKKHWNTIIIDGRLPQSLLRQQVENSYWLVRGKREKPNGAI